jgi:hypothetical protein
MELERRKYARIDIPILMELKQARESAHYSWGLTKDFSFGGFCFESIYFEHKPRQTLEFRLRFPEKGKSMSVQGDVMWKSKVDDKYFTGIKMQGMSDDMRDEFLKEISEYGSFPVSRFFHRYDAVDPLKGRDKEILHAQADIQQKIREVPVRKIDKRRITREYLETGATCMVTFILPKEVALDALRVTIVGDFNRWDKENIAMKRLNSGDFAATLKLRAGKEYKYRFLINGERWENDWNADRYDPNPFGWHDSVLII